MTQENMMRVLYHHGIDYHPCITSDGHCVEVAEDYTDHGKPGREWRIMNPSEWTLTDLMKWLGY